MFVIVAQIVPVSVFFFGVCRIYVCYCQPAFGIIDWHRIATYLESSRKVHEDVLNLLK